MDQRAFERHPTSFHAVITRLAQREHTARGCVDNISKTGVCIMLSLQLTPGELVKLEIADSLLFGHVVFCNPEPPQFRIGIEVERVLLGGTDLSEILQDLLAAECSTLAP